MDNLLNKYYDYLKLVGCKLVYTLQNGEIIEAVFKEDNFLHLLGLHKLKDISIIQQWLDKSNYTVKNKDVIRYIRTGRLSDSMIKNSNFYNEIENRYNVFSYETLSTLSYTNAVINFNPKLVNSKLISDYILFEKDINNEFNHMAIAYDKNTKQRYLESFFHETGDNYINGQVIVKVRKYQLLNVNGEIIFTDEF